MKKNTIKLQYRLNCNAILISQLKKKSPKRVKPPHPIHRTMVRMYNFNSNCHTRHLENSRRAEYFTSCVVNFFIQYIDTTNFYKPTQQSPSSKQALREEKHIKVLCGTLSYKMALQNQLCSIALFLSNLSALACAAS